MSSKAGGKHYETKFQHYYKPVGTIMKKGGGRGEALSKLNNICQDFFQVY